MTMEQPQHEMGDATLDGTPPLNYGEAGQLNDQIAQADPPLPGDPGAPAAEALDPNGPPDGVDLSGKPDTGNDFHPANEDEEILYGPTERPGERIGSGANPRARRPKGLETFLPQLAKAASEPDAPQELHDFMTILSYHLGR